MKIITVRVMSVISDYVYNECKRIPLHVNYNISHFTNAKRPGQNKGLNSLRIDKTNYNCIYIYVYTFCHANNILYTKINKNNNFLII